GHAARDAGADAADGGGAGCTVAVDGGTVACTTQIVSAHDYDLYCALKADGRINCWGSDGYAFVFPPYGTIWTTAIAKAPPHLVQLAMTNGLTSDPMNHLLCGVDREGTGTCWSDQGSKTIGQGLRAIATSIFGLCTLDATGAVACGTAFVAPPATGVYARIVASEELAGALDVAGVPFYPYATFPAGTYVDIAANDARHVAAVRSDGAAVFLGPGPGAPTVRSGSFTHAAVDYNGRGCAIDAAGAITCWASAADGGVPAPTPPAGTFVQIAGATETFCAVRTSGTTACFGDTPIEAPAGW
ncbi:MAG TPA: hypothetical protein VHO06_25530, partial [Polyangia bacterium]|nr:hypothetical protein [Polyangia bacterium]